MVAVDMTLYDQQAQSSDLTILVDAIVKEESCASRERRSAHRVPLVRPVVVEMNGEARPFYSFSKNISACGIGLIMRLAPPNGTAAKLSIQRMHGDAAQVRAELRWCEPFGDGWYLTGWKFLAPIRD